MYWLGWTHPKVYEIHTSYNNREYFTLAGCAMQSTRPSQSEIFYFKAVIVGTIFHFERVCHPIYNNRKYFTAGNGRPTHTYEQREQSTITPTQSEIFSFIVHCSYVLAS